MATKKAKPPTDPLDQLLAAHPTQLLLVLLWQQRIANPGMTFAITEPELKALYDCLGYLKKEAEIRAFRRGDKVIVGVVDAGSKCIVRRHDKEREKDVDIEVPVEDGQPVLRAGDLVVSIGDAITPVENNEADYDRSQAANQVRRIREGARQLATAVKADALAGTFSSAMVTELADAHLQLAQATAE